MSKWMEAMPLEVRSAGGEARICGVETARTRNTNQIRVRPANMGNPPDDQIISGTEGREDSQGPGKKQERDARRSHPQALQCLQFNSILIPGLFGDVLRVAIHSASPSSLSFSERTA